MSGFYHASRPAPSRGNGAAGALPSASGTRGLLGAMARFHARVGVRLALRILAPSLAILFALYFILRPEFFVYLAGVILGDSGPLARGAFAALTATVAARAAAARVCAGLGGWMRHLPSSAALTRRMAILAIAVAEMPVIVILAGFAAVSARSASASLPADLAGFAALAPAAAIAAVRTRNRAPRAVLGFTGAALCASGRWLLLAAGLVLAVAAERIAGPVRGPKRKNSVFDGRHALGLPAAVARRAVGKAIAVPYLIGIAVLALAAAFLANNPLPPATAGAAARLGGALALTAFLAAASSLLAARRPPWPLERSWPRSARARVATDALLLSVPAAALLAPLAAVNPGPFRSWPPSFRRPGCGRPRPCGSTASCASAPGASCWARARSPPRP
jgi:hypothetical protein